MSAVVAALLAVPTDEVLAVAAVLLLPCVLLCVLAFQEPKPSNRGDNCQDKPDRCCNGDNECTAELREERIRLNPEHDKEYRQETDHADAETESAWVPEVVAPHKAVKPLRCKHRKERRGDEAYGA